MSELAGRIHHTNTVRAETAGLSGHYMNLRWPLRRLNEADYIVVGTATNQLLFISNAQVVLKAPCLTGSGKEFTNPVDGRKWVFNTPRGEFHITSKVRDLFWRWPDWTFTGKDPLENGIVEDYALGFGNGYFIHGMLDVKSIGRNVLHGCIRLDEPDPHALFKRTHVGTPLLIF